MEIHTNTHTHSVRPMVKQQRARGLIYINMWGFL